MEEWRTIPGFENYAVSSLGNVKRINPSKFSRVRGLFKPHRNSDGYYTTSLYNEKGKQSFFVHQLVALAFIGPRTAPEIAHLDGNPGNNEYTNLKYVTVQENNLQKHFHGTMIKGENVYNASVSNEEAQTMRKLNKEGLSAAKIARMFGLKYATAYNICKGISKYAAVFTLIVLTACTPRVDVRFDGVSESGKATACAVFEPIYLEPTEIAALSRVAKVKIAAHNQTFERLCGEQ